MAAIRPEIEIEAPAERVWRLTRHAFSAQGAAGRAESGTAMAGTALGTRPVRRRTPFPPRTPRPGPHSPHPGGNLRRVARPAPSPTDGRSHTPGLRADELCPEGEGRGGP